MKKIFLLATAALAFGTVAATADSAFDGAYVGVEGGFGTTDLDPAYDEEQGFSGGAFAGYGVTHNRFYFAAEVGGGFDNSEWHDTDGINEANFSRDFIYGATAKAGYLVTDKVVGYALAGIQRAEGEETINGEKYDIPLDGLRFGVGAESLMKDNLSVRSEFTYTEWEYDGVDVGDEFRSNIGLVARF